jgi:hypothetical protein
LFLFINNLTHLCIYARGPAPSHRAGGAGRPPAAIVVTTMMIMGTTVVMTYVRVSLQSENCDVIEDV